METCEPCLNDGVQGRHETNDFIQRMFRKKLCNQRWELSVSEQCCCLPLKRRFLVLAYFKLVLSLAPFLGILHFLLLMYIIFSRDEMFKHGVAWAALCINVVDIVIGVVIIVCAYKKNIIFMEMYYRCSIYVFGLLSILCCLIFHMMYGSIYALLIIITSLILVIRVSKSDGEERSYEIKKHITVPDFK